MNVFRNTNLTWWQVEIFNISVFTVGLLVGAYFFEWVQAWIVPIAIIALIGSLYISYVWFNQHKN